MAMQMQRAFNSRMLTKMTQYSLSKGEYDENNRWVQGEVTQKKIFGVIKAGNKFSQMEEGEALHAEDGGARYSEFRTLYVTDKYPISMEDKIGFKGKYFKVLQKSDEEVYGFYSVLLEKSKDWTP